MMTLLTFIYGVFVGVEMHSVETEALEYERSRVEVFKEDVDSRLGRFFYLPVWIYAKAIDSYEMKRASE